MKLFTKSETCHQITSPILLKTPQWSPVPRHAEYNVKVPVLAYQNLTRGLTLTLHQPQSPCCSLDMPSRLQPNGLCMCYPLSLGHNSPI